MRSLFPSRPLPLLLLAVALFTFLIQSGELGTSDTAHRLQVTHSLWTAQPQIFPNEYPEAGIHGPGGRLYAWWGIGQSLLMLPADLVATAATHLPLWRNYVDSQTDPTIRAILVSFSSNILLSVLTALVAFRLLILFGFTTPQSIAGTLALEIATTHLHYAQSLTENNYIFLLTLTGFLLQYKWLTTGSRRALFWGSAALGLNLLTRLTTALDILAVACFLILAALLTPNNPAPPPRPTRSYLAYTAPIYAFFLLIDRIYQFVRFDSWTNTYNSIFGREQRMLDPSLPANFPFSGHWLHGGIDSGLLGPFFSPAKSVFLFDPLFPLILLLTLRLWKHLAPHLRAFLISTYLLLAAYVLLYARFYSWAGDTAWGDRYISSAVELTTLLAIPLLLRHRRTLGRAVYSLGLAITAVSVAVQCASLAFWVSLERYQMDTFGPHACVILLRFKNILAFALHRRRAWGLLTPSIFQDPWDAAHISTWNFLPSLLRHIGAVPLWSVDILYAVWSAVTLALIFTSARLVRAIRQHP